MAVEVVVRVSPRMYDEDVAALREWLERHYPGEWTEKHASPDAPGLSVGELVLAGMLGGVGEAAAKAAFEAVRDMLRNLTQRYPETEPPPASVEAVTLPDEGDIESAGTDRDAG
jgi:hypothetical protein